MFDYLIVGAGLYGSIFAHEANKRGKKCLIIDRRNHIGGNCYSENQSGINVHKYGAHIFHTNNEQIWKYINQFAKFNHYINSPIAYYKNRLFNLPFNMNTFYQLWGVKQPHEAMAIIDEQRKEMRNKLPENLEEQAIALVGRDIYEILIKGYTQKQWGKQPRDLPAFIIKRIPVRFTFDNNYFNDPYQGIPIGGYTNIFAKLLIGIEVRLGVDYFTDRAHLNSLARKTVFTGMLDQFYDYKFGYLEYRSLKFEHELLEQTNFQGNAVVNYTDIDVPYTRIIEHKHFEFGDQPQTIITKEYPLQWTVGAEPYYPVNDSLNNERYKKYSSLTQSETNVIFGGRLADYQYYDMHHVIAHALKAIKKEFGE